MIKQVFSLYLQSITCLEASNSLLTCIIDMEASKQASSRHCFKYVFKTKALISFLPAYLGHEK